MRYRTLKNLEIKGKTNEKFNRVSLFNSGSDVSPYKTSYVTSVLPKN